MSLPDVRLKGAVLYIVGSLSTLERTEAQRLIQAAGGCLAESWGPDTTHVVLGHGELGLSADGEPDASALRFRVLAEGGRSPRVLTEVELLEHLGLARQVDELGQLYTTQQLARILDLPVERLRSWVRWGLIQPVRVQKRLAWFDFREVMAARALARLVDTGVAPQKIRRSLEEISTWHPGARGVLVQLEALTAGDGLGVRLPGGGVASPSGQLLFEFREGAAAAPEAGAAVRRGNLRLFDPRAGALGDPERSAEEWFQTGLDAEDRGEMETAADAYVRSLDVGGPQPETLFNLGNVRYRRGEMVEAAQCFLRALDLDPEYVECWNNLGNAFAGLKRADDAISSYRRALQIEPRYAEAHANLAHALEAQGRTAEARQHWMRYVGAEPQGERAARVRRMLGIVRGGASGDA